MILDILDEDSVNTLSDSKLCNHYGSVVLVKRKTQDTFFMALADHDSLLGREVSTEFALAFLKEFGDKE